MTDRIARPAYFTKFDIIRQWHSIEQMPVVFIVSEGRKFLIEGPEERTDLEGVMALVKRIRLDSDARSFEEKFEEYPKLESVLRCFTEYEDACMYMDLMQSIYGEEFPLTVESAPVDGLFMLREDIVQTAHAEKEAPVRFDMCSMRMDDEWPSVVDTLWAETTLYN